MNRTRRAAWVVLVTISALFTVNHLVCLVVVDDEQPWVFLTFALLNAAAVAVLIGPYRRLRPAAWAAVWVEVAALASTVAWTEVSVWTWYLAAAAVMAWAQCATLGAFRGARSLASGRR